MDDMEMGLENKIGTFFRTADMLEKAKLMYSVIERSMDTSIGLAEDSLGAVAVLGGYGNIKEMKHLVTTIKATISTQLMCFLRIAVAYDKCEHPGADPEFLQLVSNVRKVLNMAADSSDDYYTRLVKSIDPEAIKDDIGFSFKDIVDICLNDLYDALATDVYQMTEGGIE